MSFKLLSIFVILLVHAYGNVLPGRTTLGKPTIEIDRTISDEDLMKMFKEEKDEEERLRIFQRVIDERRILYQQLYATECSTPYEFALWYMEGKFMSSNFINRRPYVLAVRDELVAKHFDSIFVSGDSPFPQAQAYYTLASEEEKQNIHEEFKGIMSCVLERRDFRWELFLTWLTTTKENIPQELLFLSWELVDTMELGFTIDDFIQYILHHFELATSIVKVNSNGTNLLEKYEVREQMGKLYEELMLVEPWSMYPYNYEDYGEEFLTLNEFKEKEFLAHRCAQLLQKTLWNSKDMECWTLQTTKLTGKPQIQMYHGDNSAECMSYPEAIQSFVNKFQTKKMSKPITEPATKS